MELAHHDLTFQITIKYQEWASLKCGSIATAFRVAPGEHTFYWWTPDPTFLELAPLPLQFPPFNAREFAQSILTSSGSSTSIDTIVSQDLAILAPTVEKFADKLQLTLSQMDEILLDQKNTGDSWENVTCRWILANRAAWQKWIPDESECAPGFGLFDQILSEFTDTRVNVTNKIICEAAWGWETAKKQIPNIQWPTQFIW
jgi:hypothetical protein